MCFLLDIKVISSLREGEEIERLKDKERGRRSIRKREKADDENI